MIPTKVTKNAPSFKYPSLAEVKAQDARHVDLMRGLIAAGAKPTDVLTAYVIARYPEVEAGTLLRVVVNGKQGRRPLGTEEERAEACGLLRKHGGTHLKLALAGTDPSLAADAADKARKALDNAQAAVKRAQTKLAKASAPRPAVKVA